ncbi:hypothetical protein BLNAU_1539 [Blattamonas nauphoetae]|uniref:Right handed beta helix domain-containing protein n=1 Tax=Blattamonas nauphoetae TaxID=2049346 RepID=A0ABQ9YIA5_9EUKA|nr:hypothetical protein BLNAU_1539 [Blattamonas nauphoetae]
MLSLLLFLNCELFADVPLEPMIPAKTRFGEQLSLKANTYTGSRIHLPLRTLLFRGADTASRVILRAEYVSAPLFDLQNTSLQLDSLSLIPNNGSAFIVGNGRNEITMVSCVHAYSIRDGAFVEIESGSLNITHNTFLGRSRYDGPFLARTGYSKDALTLLMKLCSVNVITMTTLAPLLASADVSSIQIIDCTFSAIQISPGAQRPAPVVESSMTSVTINGSRFVNVEGPLSGGIVFGLKYLNLNIHGSFFTNCTGTTSFAETVKGQPIPNYNFRETYFTDCHSLDAIPNGGGLVISTYCQMTMNSVTFRGCKAKGKGGAIAFTDMPKSLNFTSCSFVDNSATGGGGLYFAKQTRNVDKFEMMIMTWSNTVDGNGTDILFEMMPNISGSNFTMNKSTSKGKLIYDERTKRMFYWTNKS